MLNTYDGRLCIMIAMPRSGTYWMAQALRPYCTDTWHDPLRQCSSVDELGNKVDAVIVDGLSTHDNGEEKPLFIADTGALFFQDEIAQRFPGARILFVDRDFSEVQQSVAKMLGVPEINKRPYLYAFNQLMTNRIHLKTGHRCLEVDFDIMFNDLRMQLILKHLFGQRVNQGKPTLEYDFLHFDSLFKSKLAIPVRDQIASTDNAKVAVLFRHHIGELQ